MKLRSKFTILFTLCGTIFILVSFAIFNRQLHVNNETESITHATEHIDLISSNIGTLIDYEIDMANYIANRPEIIQLLNQSNSEYYNYSEQELKSSLDNMNEKWLQSDEESEIVQTLFQSELSHKLNSVISATGNRYGEIFITNKYGVAVGSTAKLTTVVHNYKHWWKQAFASGEGKIFIDDRGYDESAGAYVLGFVIPVISNSEIIGILKCNVNIEHLLTEFIEYEEALGVGWNIIVARSGGIIIYKNGSEPMKDILSEEITQLLNDEDRGNSWITENSDRVLYIYNPIKPTISNSVYNFGGTPETIDHNLGNSGENWCILATRTEKALHTKTDNTTKRYLLLTTLLTILYIAIAFYISHTLTRSINKINNGIKKITKGNLKTRIDDYPKDETGEIAKSINFMAEHLNETLTSKTELQNLVDEKQHLLKEFNHRVKNNLLLVSSFIALKKAESDCENDLSDIQNQIEAIQLTHELLISTDSFYNIDFKNYFQKLADNLFQSYHDSIKIESHIEIDEINVNIAKTLGLIINETATNMIKYSGHQNKEVKYSVALKEDNIEGRYILEIYNTGTRIPEDVGLDNPKTMGLQIISALTKQLHGSIRLERTPHPTFTIIFPK